MKTKTLLAIGTLTSMVFAQCALAEVTIFTDGFELGTVNYWTSDGTPLKIDNTKSIFPAIGAYSALMDYSADRMHRNIIADNGGSEVDGYSTLSAWIYDDTATRGYVQALGYTGTGLPNGGTVADGTLAQILAIGKYNSVTLPGDVYDPTKYQARVLYGANAGWFNLNAPGAPSRSAGWHEFTIAREGNDTTIDFYVDGILGRTIAGATPQTWDTITMGFGSGTSSGNTWFDGIVVTVPEPSTLTLSLLGGLGLAVAAISRRRKA